jgi:predicted RNA binding protein YcfA (HicA-like mRNA interferase family)
VAYLQQRFLRLGRVAAVDLFPTMKAKRLLAVLERQPLGYRTVRRAGSHRRMESPSYPPLTFAFHDKATVPSGLVRKILTKDVGLAEDEARKLL